MDIERFFYSLLSLSHSLSLSIDTFLPDQQTATLSAFLPV